MKKKKSLIRDLKENGSLLSMCIPGLIFFILFNYLPMFGIIIAFKQYRYDLGIWASPWNGLKNFEFMFSSPDAWVITRNTIAYNLLFIFGGLVFNVAMAIGLSELRNKAVSKLCQTVVIMPHFLSYVIVSFLVLAFLHVENGLINRSLIPALGLEGVDWYSNPKYWPWILVIVNFWKTTGYGSVVYLAGIAGIDTRALAKILREKGTMNGMITTNENYNLEEVLPKIKEYTVSGVVKKVTCKEKSVLNGDGFKVALLDFGAKKNIARSLNNRGCEVTIYPAETKAEEILASNPDGIMLSNGPGDPKECTEIIEELKKLYASDVPMFAICLGHQLMALATGADTHKLKYGHRGANHPVKDLMTGRVYISSQNHGYVVDETTLDPNVAKPAFENVNDKTNEGLEYVGKNIFTVQFHPEACAGPQDTAYLFDRFIDMMKMKKEEQ